MCDAPGQKLNSAAELFYFKNWATAESNQPGSPWGKTMPNVTSGDLSSSCELLVPISHFHCVFLGHNFAKYLFKWVKRGLSFRVWRVGRETASPFVLQKYERCLCMRLATWPSRVRNEEVEGGTGREGKAITVTEPQRGVTQNIGNIFSINQVFKKDNLILVSLLVLQLAINIGIRITNFFEQKYSLWYKWQVWPEELISF